MTKKYTSPEEDERIRELYRTGKHTFEKIGQMYHISKSTAINIIKEYPYTGDKVEYWRRVYRETVTNMDAVLSEIRGNISNSLAEHDSIGYNTFMRQEEHLLSFSLTDPETLYNKIKHERNDIEQTAWGHLSENNYTEFAYFQSLWVQLSKILADNRKNPWGELPEKTGARGRAKSIKYYSNKDFKEFRQYSRNYTEKDYIISDKLYNELEKCISANTGRPLKNPGQRISIILNLFQSGESPQKYKSWDKIYRSYGTWFRSGVFRVLWEVNETYPELQPIKAALLMIERHRMIDPYNPPRFKSVQDANRREGKGVENI